MVNDVGGKVLATLLLPALAPPPRAAPPPPPRSSLQRCDSTHSMCPPAVALAIPRARLLMVNDGGDKVLRQVAEKYHAEYW